MFPSSLVPAPSVSYSILKLALKRTRSFLNPLPVPFVKKFIRFLGFGKNMAALREDSSFTSITSEDSLLPSDKDSISSKSHGIELPLITGKDDASSKGEFTP